ncbi:helix-turn-helix domain-containing protein [Tenacibaculum halocynthiae]|uniref:helix-turn-helix domain-containing protein n=1 Tax=Tenacibaculum halocynthiae TaxID=1254437 RepID=UPI003D649F8F
MAKKIIFAFVLFSFIYILTYKIYHSWLHKNYRNSQILTLKWMYRIVIIFAFLSFIWGPYSISDYVTFIFKLSVYTLLFIITIRIGSKYISKSEVAINHNNETCVNKSKPTEEIIKKASWLKEQMLINLFYLNSELTLKSLAENLNMHPNILSKVINEGLGKNFSDFVNEYRVNAIIEKMQNKSYDHITLLGLSFECGFNSKTTFNRVFKNIKGVTPLQYKKSLKNTSEAQKMSPIL